MTDAALRLRVIEMLVEEFVAQGWADSRLCRAPEMWVVDCEGAIDLGPVADRIIAELGVRT